MLRRQHRGAVMPKLTKQVEIGGSTDTRLSFTKIDMAAPVRELEKTKMALREDLPQIR